MAVVQELRDVPGASGSVTDADPIPAELLDVLRSAVKAATDAYAKVEVGGNLRAELEQADNTESLTGAKLAAVAPAIRDLATALDLHLRTARTRPRAPPPPNEPERTVSTLDGELMRAQLPGRRPFDAAVKQFTTRGGSLELSYGKADRCRARARKSHRTSRGRSRRRPFPARSRPRCQGPTSNGPSRWPRSRATDSAACSDSLHGAAQDTAATAEDAPSTERFGGDADFARSRRDDIWASLDDAEENCCPMRNPRSAGAADELAQYAAEARFENVTSPVRRQMIKVRRDELLRLRRCRVGAGPCDRVLRSLDDDLAHIDRHRIW